MPIAPREKSWLPAVAVSHRLPSRLAARGAIVGNALFPNLTGYTMKIINRFLPGAAGEAARIAGWRASAPTNTGMDDASGRSRDDRKTTKSEVQSL